MKINFCMMKNYSTFAAFLQGTNFLTFVCVVFFIATNTALNAAIIGYHSDSYYTERSVIVPCRTEKGSLSSFKYFNFSFMQGTMKDYSGANNSNAVVTSTGTKSVEISQLFNPKFIEFTSQLSNMRDWLDVYRQEFACDDEFIHKHLLDAESHLYSVVSEFADMLAIEFKEKVYFKNL